jgi:peptidoglycan hydrolase-like protein with peptidoglycan-binding domain
MPDPILPWPLVKSGSHEHPTRTLQDLLNAHGSALVIDGVFGPKTDAAVRHFQQSKSLTVDGVVGAQTWAAVILTVRQGSSGDAVRGVQEEFAFRNLSGIPGTGLKIDGVFGPKTDAAVRGFQEALSIAVDGIVGAVTWRALVSGMLAG